MRVFHMFSPGIAPAWTRRRGSVLILVLALLSILLILATTLSFTSRLEMAATENFARSAQGRFAALSAVSTAGALFNGDPELTHSRELWALVGPADRQPLTPPTGAQTTQTAGPNLGVTPVPRVGSAPDQTSGPGVSPISLTYRRTAEGELPVDPQTTATVPADTGSVTTDTEPQTGAISPPRGIRPGMGMVEMEITDESARLDLNCVGALAGDPQRRVADSATVLNLEAFLEEALREAQWPESEIPANTLARAIILWRLGPDGEPGVAGEDDDGDSQRTDLRRNGIDDDGNGVIDDDSERALALAHNGVDDNGDGEIDDGHEGLEHDGRDNDGDGVIDETLEGVDEPDEFRADPRLTPRGDDRHYDRVEDLLQVPGMTPEIFEVIAPMLTVHSASETRATRVDDETERRPLVDVNRADFDAIRDQLEAYFPERSPELLTLFTLRILDARDEDSVPSIPPDLEGYALPPLGLEQTPLINEVWPDSETDTSDGDDGQYVEILNPWPNPYDLRNCQLSAGGLTTRLSGVLPPGGMLLVTDDFDETQDDDPEIEVEGYGSFLEIFHLVPNGSSRQMVVDENFSLPDTAGTVLLRDAEGNLLDWFRYSVPPHQAERRVSFQRDDPRVRLSSVHLCSPFEENRSTRPPDSFEETYRGAVPRNMPFATPADLMLVFSGWEGAPNPERRGWAFPEIHSSDSDALDSRLVDIFSVGPLEPLPDGEEEEEAEEPPAETLDIASAAVEDEEGCIISGREWAVGRININTAPRAVLMALPGMTEELAGRILAWRAQVELGGVDGEPVASAPFTRRGDLLRNGVVWQGVPLRDRLRTYRQMVNVITVSSASCRVEATAANVSGRRMPTTSPRSLAASLLLRDGRLEIVNLDFTETLP
ncbi:hypothetical protein JXA47_03995 [Candidatus Sumerlaeota bacterium]|nr:hypothetical protein [Candidatus Sumerlaeota bacterium]